MSKEPTSDKSKPGTNAGVVATNPMVDKKVQENKTEKDNQKVKKVSEQKVEPMSDNVVVGQKIKQEVDKKAADPKAKRMHSEKKEKVGEKNTPTKRRFWMLSFLFNLLLLGGLGFLAILFVDQKTTLDRIAIVQNQTEPEREATLDGLADLQGQTVDFASQIVDANSQLAAQGLQLVEATNLVSQHSLELGRLNRELISTRLRINDTGTAVNQEWLLAEVESLLRLAQQELIVTGDVHSAIALFLASDDILSQINDPAIFSIRQVLAADLITLRAVTDVDVQAIYNQLGEVNQKINTLQVTSGLTEQSASTEEIDLRSDNESNGTGALNAVLDKISEYIVIRRRDEDIQPLLTPDQQIYIKQNIQLQLQQARLALLREHESIYRSSIAEAIENIEQFLISEDAEKQNILQLLMKLQTTEIAIQVPAASNTLMALREILVVNNPSSAERERRQEVETER